MRSPLFWKIFLSFWLTAVLINQSTWVIYLVWYEPGPSWERMQSQQDATIELGAARAVIETSGLQGFRRYQMALPIERRANVKVDVAGSIREDADTRTAVASAPDGRSLTLAYALKGVAEQRWGMLEILYRSMDYFVASLLGGVVFAAALAWYLTRPIQRVRSGFEALAGGDLGTRLAPTIGRRRDEFADLARDFDRMAERLQQLVCMRDQLLHDVSHELRSPLARMNLAIALQRKDPSGSSISLGRIEAEARRLDELVGELLSLARAESGSGHEDSYFDLGGLVEAVAGNARFEAQTGNVDVRTHYQSDDVIIRGSAELMRRALENVLRNGVRVSPPGSAVHVTLEAVSNGSGKTVVLIVADEGPGVPPDKLEAMFDPFVRIEGSPRNASGYGLGLAIARRAISALGGSIRAENSAPHGLAVIMRLPLTSIAIEKSRE